MLEVYRFQFDHVVSEEIIDEQITEAVLAVESIYGKAKVRLETALIVSKNRAVIEVSTEVGQRLAQIFTGFMTHKVGENSFTVEHLKNKTIKDAI